ncbi:MAG: DUF4249 domain-containing protein [Bacteroidales bacterium]|nr:DUF4249 domain-containing protein [Bacteroidales bacterium]
MKNIQQIILFSFLLLLNSCIVQFIPETDEDKELLVVEGLITDQPEAYTVKLSKSLPLGRKNVAKPLKGCIVKISDDMGNTYSLKETVAGTYVTDPAKFQGTIGRWYTLHINTNTSYNNLNYESFPMELKPVPKIDSIYYEKKIIREKDEISQALEGCQVYLNTYDPENNCSFYRWEYSETWEFRLPYDVTNRVCWLSNNSDRINVKNTSVFEEDRINRYPLNFISNTTDRLRVKYSMLVNQYSLNEDEYLYWEKLQNIAEQVGGLYDITPAAIPSNVWCLEDPNEKVLGYFSVSARSSKRIFIKDYFQGIINLYNECISDTIPGGVPIPNLGISVWVIEYINDAMPPSRVVTENRGCADCTVRGTNKEPVFWKEGK